MIYKTGDCGSVCNWGRVFKLIRVLLLFTASVVSDSLRSHGLQHARLPCPSPSPGLRSNSCPLSWWCPPTISSSVAPFSSCCQSFPASGSFQMSHFFTSGSQSIRVSASASVLPVNIQDWFPLRWTGCVCVYAHLVAQLCLTLCVPMDFQAPLSLGFSRQEY